MNDINFITSANASENSKIFGSPFASSFIKYATSGSCLILFTNTSTFDAFKSKSLERTSEFAILLFVPVSEPTKSSFANVLTALKWFTYVRHLQTPLSYTSRIDATTSNVAALPYTNTLSLLFKTIFCPDTTLRVDCGGIGASFTI